MNSRQSDLKIDRMNDFDIKMEEGFVIRLGKYTEIEVSKPARDVSKHMAERQCDEKSESASKQKEIIETIISGSQIDISDKIIEKEAMKMVEEFAKRLGQQGLSIEQYYGMSGINEEQLQEQMMCVAKRRAKGRIVLNAIAKAEHLEATEDEYENEINRLSARYLTGAKEIKMLIAGKEEKQIRKDIAIQKAMNFVMNSSVEK